MKLACSPQVKIRLRLPCFYGRTLSRTDEIPAAIEKQAEPEKQAACLLFRLGGISSCWLLPGGWWALVQILVDVMNLAFSPQVKIRLRLTCFYGRTLSRTVSAVCTVPSCQEMAQIHPATKSQASAWNSTNSCQITKFLTRPISVLSLSRKFVHNHRCCPIPAAILMAF